MLKVDEKHKPVHVGATEPHTVKMPSHREALYALDTVKEYVLPFPEALAAFKVLERFVKTR